ncbi:MAG: hypothetical protein ACTSR8_19065 [Promethearchaeota archaeon]
MKDQDENSKNFSKKDDLIVSYILNNSMCSFTDLTSALAHEYGEKSKRKYMSRKTLTNRLKFLIKVKHIIAHGKRNTKSGEEDDIFTVRK